MFRTSRFIPATLVLVSLLIACSDSPSEPARTPTSIELSETTLVLDDGAATQLSAVLRDWNGQAFSTPPSGFVLSWSSVDAHVASVSQTGLVQANRPGETEIRVTAGSLQASASLTVRVAASVLQIVGGDAQQGTVGAVLPEPITVRVADRHDTGVDGVVVRFTAGEGGSIAPDSLITDPDGLATTSWRLGTTSGAQTASAAAGVVGVSFDATALPGGPHTIAALSAPGDPIAGGVVDSVTVQVSDAFGNVTPGRSLTWIVTAGGGSVTPYNPTTGADGELRARWTMGDGFGAQNVVRVSLVDDPSRFIDLSVVASAPAAPFRFEPDFVWIAPTLDAPIVVLDDLDRAVPGRFVTFEVRRLDALLEASQPATNSFSVNRDGALSVTAGALSGHQPLEVTASISGVSVGGGVYALAVPRTDGWEATATRHWRILAPSGWAAQWRSRLPGFFDVVDVEWEAMRDLFDVPNSIVAYATPPLRRAGRPAFSVAWIDPQRSGCASAGHPVTFGMLCVDWEWTYEVFAHELGHNLSYGLEELFAVEIIGGDFKLSEGETGLMMSWWANHIAVESGSLDPTTHAHVAGRLAGFTSHYFDDWVQSGQAYSTLDQSHIVSMHARLIGEYGWLFWNRYVRAWRENVDVRTLLNLDSPPLAESARATFVAAAASAAAAVDLSSRFRDDWRFPLDDALFSQLLPLLQVGMGS